MVDRGGLSGEALLRRKERERWRSLTPEQRAIELILAERAEAKRREGLKYQRPERHKFYQSKEWKALSRAYLDSHPVCEKCLSRGAVTPSRHVDHIVELRDGGEPLDESNLQALCIPCHNAKTKRERRKREGEGGKKSKGE